RRRGPRGRAGTHAGRRTPVGHHAGARPRDAAGRGPARRGRPARRAQEAAAGDAMKKLDVTVITGMAGSGKSVALHALEDSGTYCVDNLPPELLAGLLALEHAHHGHRVAVAMDVRSVSTLPQVPRQLEQLRKSGVSVRSLFLDA